MDGISIQTRDNLTDFKGLFHVEHSTPGQRLFQIRLACGDGRRKPESLREFANRVARATGDTYQHAAISLLERDEQGWRLKDVHNFTAVDPLKRGECWLAFGDVEEVAVPMPRPTPVVSPAQSPAAKRGLRKKRSGGDRSA